MDQITAYLKSISNCPELYDAWQSCNDRLFDGALKPIPIIIGLSDYGSAAGFCAMDCICIQPSVYFSGKGQQQLKRLLGTIVHEMCHQADHLEGHSYKQEKRTRVNNIHNTQTWCDRINGVMQRIGDKRFAIVYRRNRDGEMVPLDKTPEIPEGLSVISYADLKSWQPDPGCIERAL